jgi:CBS domain containing-hemolysin-like protein
VPETGETVRFQGLEVRTARVDGRRITSVEIRPFEEPDDDEQADESLRAESA